MNSNYTTLHQFIIAAALLAFFLAGVRPWPDTAPGPGWRYGRGLLGWGLFLWLLSTVIPH